jgi:hypothetical protein
VDQPPLHHLQDRFDHVRAIAVATVAATVAVTVAVTVVATFAVTVR